MAASTSKAAEISTHEYVDEKCSKFINVLGTSIYFIPARSRNPWITPGIIESIKVRNSLLQNKLKRKKKLSKTYKSKIVHLIKVARENYFKDQINVVNKNNPIKQWELLYYFLKINKYKNDIEIECNKLNDHFVNIGSNLASKIPFSKIKSENYINPNSIFFEPICDEEIKLKISSLKNRTTPGSDNVNVKGLKAHKDSIATSMAELFNLFINTNYFPKQLKHAIIAPIYKKNGLPKDDVNNYRPISLISNVSKIFEKCIYSRIVNFLEKNKILSKSQFGFREGKNTEKAISKLMSLIKTEKKCKMVIFFDLKKAFDTVDHNILIRKLDNMGIRGNTLELLKSYLNNRTCCTKIKSKLSNTKTINCGVPQGTSLGPLLFNIYINSLAKIKINGELVLFADDTALVVEADNHTELYQKANGDLIKIRDWLIENKLSLNISKTQYIDFSEADSYNKLIIHDFTCTNVNKCCCPKLEKVNEYKYLGCIIDQKLTFDTQVNEIINKINNKKKLSIFYILKEKSFKKSVYSALIQSHLQYAISIWGERDKLNKLQDIVNNITTKFEIEGVDSVKDLLLNRLKIKKEYYNLHYLILQYYEIFKY